MSVSLRDKIRSIFARKAVPSSNAQPAIVCSEDTLLAPAGVQVKSRQARRRFKSRWANVFRKRSKPARTPTPPQYGCVPWSNNFTSRPTVLPTIGETSQERCNELSEVRQPVESTHRQSQASTEEDEGYGDELEDSDDSDDSDGKIEYKEVNEHDRCDWHQVNGTPHHAFARLVQRYYLSVGEAVDARETYRTKGAFNLIVFVKVKFSDDTTTTVVIRIPANGVEAHWTPKDAYMMEREVQLVDYIGKKTSVPVPVILQYSNTLRNNIGCPYTLMTKLPGQAAFSIWFDQPYDPVDPFRAYRDADIPSAETKKKRINLLRSLARVMAELQTLTFDKIGMPVITEEGNTAGPSHHWTNEDDIDKPKKRPAFETTRAYIQASLAESFTVNPKAEKNAIFFTYTGIRKILDVIFSQPVFNSPEPEMFTLHHNDLDFQNILVDEEGNVTGIIDWDKTYTAPRCIGAASVPMFLRSDWFPRYVNDLRVAPHMAWNQHRYRKIYAAAMVEAGAPDAKYTLKSAVYQAALAAIYEGGDCEDFIEKVLRYIPECHVDTQDFLQGVGQGWPSAVRMLECELGKIFEPALPCAEVLGDLNEEMQLNEWWPSFDGLLIPCKGEVRRCGEDGGS